MTPAELCEPSSQPCGTTARSVSTALASGRLAAVLRDRARPWLAVACCRVCCLHAGRWLEAGDPLDPDWISSARGGGRPRENI